MRINTPQSIKLGESLYAEYGSWKKVREAATLRNGVYVLPPRADAGKPPETKSGER